MRKSRKSALSSKKQKHINHQATKRHVAQMTARVGNGQNSLNSSWIDKQRRVAENFTLLLSEAGLGGMIV